MNITEKIAITQENNLELMKRYPDKYFDVAIVDPPYGISEKSYRKTPGKTAAAKKKNYNMNLWDQEKPCAEYWAELVRVSKNQIVWGGNYFTDFLPPSRNWAVWDKCTKDSLFADVELAWTSWNNSAKLFTFRWNGMLQQDMKNKEVRIHPTQKPVGLYKWLLENYAKPGDKILDTHLGSGSIAIACHDYGFELTACEVDEKYFNDAIKRVTDHVGQQKLF